MGSQTFHQALGPGGDEQQQAALGQKQAQEVAQQRAGFRPDDRAAQEETMQPEQGQQPGGGGHAQGNQAFDRKAEGHQGFGPGRHCVGQGNELRQQAAAKTDRQQRQHPAQRALQADKAKGQQEQQMVRPQQWVTQTT